MQGLIKKAIQNGLASEIVNINPKKTTKLNDKLQSTFLDFMAYLEDTLLDGLEDIVDTPEAQSLLPDVNNLNIQNIDTSTLLTSLKEAEQELTENFSNTREILLQKLLKNWNPQNEDVN